MSKKNISFKAFSLIELSIVVLVIGILISGVVVGSNILDKAKLAGARALTKGSPVPSIKDLVVWLDVTAEESLDASETGNGLSITNWNDLNPTWPIKTVFNQNNSSLKPVYKENCINGLPCFYFSSAAKMTTTTNFGATFTSMTIFVVNVITPNNPSLCALGSNTFLSSSTWNFHAYCTGTPYYREFPYSAYTGAVSRLGIPYLYTYIDTGATSQIYVNKNQQSITTFSSYVVQKTISTTLTVGPSDGFGIGEIILYKRGLTSSERTDIENYLVKKWNIK